MRKILTSLLLILAAAPVWAAIPTSALSGRVVDDSKAPVAGAVITLTRVQPTAEEMSQRGGGRQRPQGVSPMQVKPMQGVSSYDGDFNFKSVQYGKYEVSAVFLGFDTLRQTIFVREPNINIGDLKLAEASKRIGKVTVSANSIRTSQQGDTVIYNADAFKVAKDATAEGLLSKMPGVMVSNGSVEAQGEKVKKVFVDGKEFFGEDVTTAIKNLPSEMVKSVEVYNKLSDNAEFTGMDDGEGYKAINIVTNAGLNSGQFGKFSAGYTANNRYQVGLSGNYFTDNHRFSLIAMSNNLNMQNFGVEDIIGAIGSQGGGGRRGGGGGKGPGGPGGGSSVGNFMVPNQSGISSVNAIGLNYSGNLSEQVKLEASYFFNYTDTDNETTKDRQYLTDSDLERYYTSLSNSNAINANHRFNGRFEYNINEDNMLMLRPSVSFQNYGSTYNSNYENTQIVGGGDEEYLNTNVSSDEDDRNGYNISNMMLYRTRFASGRTFIVGAYGNMSLTDTWTDYSLNQTDYLANVAQTPVETLQRIFDGSENYRISGNATYTEPLSEFGMLSADYRVNYNESTSDYLVYLFEQQANAFNPEYDPTQSNVYNSGYLTQSIGPGFRYANRAAKTMFSCNVSYQYSSLMNTELVPNDSGTKRYNFDNVTYFAMLNKPFNPSNTLRVFLRSYTGNPSVTQLQNVVNMTNPLSVSSGNPDLSPSYNHNLYATYTLSSITKGRTFMAMASGNVMQNYIGSETVMLLNPGDSYTLPNGEALPMYGQYTRPVNLNGKWDVKGMLSFGTPVNLISSNFNVSTTATYSESPSVINGLTNMQNTTGLSGSASIGSNISEYVDFTIGYSGGYNVANYDISIGALSKNEYLTQSANLNFKFQIPWGITLTGVGTYTQYRGITDDYNEEYMICNLYLGKKIFKSQRGEIQIGVNDLLNQSDVFSRNITDTYIENVTNLALGRYYGVTFTYNFRNFR